MAQLSRYTVSLQISSGKNQFIVYWPIKKSKIKSVALARLRMRGISLTDDRV